MIVDTMVQRCKRRLRSFHRAPLNRLATSINDSIESVVLEFADTSPARGDLISIGYEIMMVMQYVSNTKTATVERGYLGTTAAAHSAGAMVEINPTYPECDIKDAVLEEVLSWPPHLYRVVTVQVSAGVDPAIDLDAPPGTIGVIDIVRHAYTGEYRWDRTDGRVMEVPVADFPSGWAFFPHRNLAAPVDLEVTFAAKFVTSTFEGVTDLVATVGLNQEMEDIIPFGVAWRLLGAKETMRSASDTQPEPRFAQDYPPGAATAAAAYNQQMREKRISDNVVSLYARHPVRF